ncbi:MAG TPA: hypothetical protein VK880_08475 [Anaerolineales bacterium]|nr:hypothetical protein [Anaerolineales bacterium]
MWNYQTGRRERVLRNFQHSIGKVAFSPAGTLLCAERTNGTATCSIYVFTDPRDSDASYPLGTHDGSVTALAPVNDSQVLSSGTDGSVVSWDASARKEINRIRVNDWARNMRVSPDGGQLLLIRRGLDLLTLPDLHSVARVGKNGVFRCAAFSPDAKTMFAGTFSGQLLACRRNEKRSDRLAPEKKPLTIYPDPERVEAVEVLNRLSLLVSVGTGGEIRFFSLDGYTLLGSVTVPGGQITSLNVSPDEAFLAVGSAGSTLTLWDLRTLDMRLLLEHPFAQSEVTILPTLNTMLEHTNLSPRARQALQFAQVVLRHRFRYTIEIDGAPSIAMGEFDIEID